MTIEKKGRFGLDSIADGVFQYGSSGKANLRGADLRGANIAGVDFYLVDLRDALYDARQEQHLRGCGAILETRAL